MTAKTETKQKSWFRRHGILSIVLVFVAIGVIGAIFGESSQPSSQNASSTAPKTEAQTLFNLGEKITIENMEYTVTEVSALPVVGSTYVNKEADGTFVIISIKIKNNKNSEILLSSSDFKLKDAQGRKYSLDNAASLYLSTMGYTPIFFKTLGAGLETNGEIIFDVPEDDNGLVLEISGEGIFAGKKEVKIGNVSEF